MFKKVVDQSPVGIVITTPDGQAEYVNDGFSEITGYHYDDLIGKEVGILNLNFQYKTNASDVLLTENDWVGEQQSQKKNGEYYWERQIVSSITNSKGEIINFVAISEDITDRKQIFNDLIEAKEKAEKAEQLKSAFLANMSHEIRTPLNAILGFANILNADADLSCEERTEYIRVMNRSSSNLLQIISDVLDASKLETGQFKICPQSFPLNTMLQHLHTQFQQVMLDLGKPQIELTLLEPEAPVLLYSDELRLNQVFSSLLNNAVKFTSCGKISFGVDKIMPQTIEFIVRDTGIGIPEKDQVAVFERFRQVETKTTRLYGGNGLGLTIAKNMVELLGGEIILESFVGKGTTFRFWIPITFHDQTAQKIPEYISR